MKEHIEIIQGAGGPKARIVGHRIRVQDIAIWHDRLGMSADEIVDQFPTITLADVYAALAYYWDHRAAIEQQIAEENTFADALRQTNESVLEGKLRRLRSG